MLARQDHQLRRRLKDAASRFEKTLADFNFFRLSLKLNRQVFLRYLDSYTVRFTTVQALLARVLQAPGSMGAREVRLELSSR